MNYNIDYFPTPTSSINLAVGEHTITITNKTGVDFLFYEIGFYNGYNNVIRKIYINNILQNSPTDFNSANWVSPFIIPHNSSVSVEVSILELGKELILNNFHTDKISINFTPPPPEMSNYTYILSKIKHIKDAPVADTNDILYGLMNVDNITALKAIPSNRRGNIEVLVKYYNTSSESATSGGRKRVLLYEADTFDNTAWTNLNNWRIVDFLSSEILYVIEKTYDEIASLVSTNGLVNGQWYKITDWKTIYRQVYTNLDLEGDVEPLFIRAISTNSFSTQAVSALYPDDIITFKFSYIPTDHPNAKGWITYRSVNHVITTMFDCRAIRTRRFAPVIIPYSAGTYSKFQIVSNGGSHYVSLRDNNTDIYSTASSWYHLRTLDAYPYIFAKTTHPNFSVDPLTYTDILVIRKIDAANDSSWWLAATEDGTIQDIYIPSSQSHGNAIIYKNIISSVRFFESSFCTMCNTNTGGYIKSARLHNCTNTSVLDENIMSDISTTDNSVINGVVDGYIDGFSDGSVALPSVGDTALVSSSINNASGSFKITATMTQSNIDSFSNFVCESPLTRVKATNWVNCTIPHTKIFRDVNFVIPQLRGTLVWSPDTVTYQGLTFIKYYFDNYNTPTVEKVWAENVNQYGEATLVELV